MRALEALTGLLVALGLGGGALPGLLDDRPSDVPAAAPVAAAPRERAALPRPASLTSARAVAALPAPAARPARPPATGGVDPRRSARALRVRRLHASPLALANACEPDLNALRAARAPEVLHEHALLLLDPTRADAVRAASAAALASVSTAQAEDLVRDARRRGDERVQALLAPHAPRVD